MVHGPGLGIGMTRANRLSLVTGQRDAHPQPPSRRWAPGRTSFSPGPTLLREAPYIIPDMSGMPPPPPPAPSFSGTSATIASVVRMFLAIEAAFCRAERVTIAG